jgi:multiple sugar transport system permease protein
MNSSETGFDRFCWAVGSFLAVIYALTPIVWILSLSLKHPADLGDNRFWPQRITFEHYQAIFADAQFPAALWNSLGIAFLSTILAILIAMFAAYAVVRLKFAGRRLFMAFALSVAMFPPVSIIGPLFNIWRSSGLYDTWPGLILPYITLTLPLAIWTLSAFFREIPWDLDKAARVDGATRFQAFRMIIVPLAAPGVFSAAILVFTYLNKSGTDRPGSHSIFYRQLPFRTADRFHCRCGCGSYRSSHYSGPDFPTSDRCRTNRRSC